MFKKIDLLLLCVLSIGVVGKVESELTDIVQTESGPVRGEVLTTVLNSVKYASFRGIPYARPPVGNLRFKPPVEKEKWTDVLNATSDPSMCIQFNGTSSSVVGSEDCLYLNIFTPHTNFNESLTKPVMVWIHGGAFRTGNSNASYYGPDFILEEDVIMVSLNYRLGPLGFLNLNHENATGNCGFKDQNLALKWVQKNIAKFGGDPNQVTIFGQSAGSVAVDYHVLSNMSKGLFARSIAMSGSPLCLYWGFQTTADAEQQAFALGALLGTVTLSKDTLLKALLNAPAEDIISKTNNIPLLPFRPTIEKISIAKDEEKFITECSLKNYVTGDFNKGPHMMGFTSNETVAFAGSFSNLLNMSNVALESVKNATLSINLPFLSQISSLTTEAISNISEASVYELIEETSDLFFETGIDSKQKLMRLHNDNPIYYYRFSFNSKYSAHRSNGVDLNGVGHEDELPYILYRPLVNLPLNQPDIALMRERMVRLWTNFAKYGNPTPNGTNDSLLGVTWPNSGILGRHLEISKELSVGLRPIDASVTGYELAGLGTSPILNECSKNVLSNLVDDIKDIMGKIKSVD